MAERTGFFVKLDNLFLFRPLMPTEVHLTVDLQLPEQCNSSRSVPACYYLVRSPTEVIR